VLLGGYLGRRVEPPAALGVIAPGQRCCEVVANEHPQHGIVIDDGADGDRRHRTMSSSVSPM
jgi:hypothetical protein